MKPKLKPLSRAEWNKKFNEAVRNSKKIENDLNELSKAGARRAGRVVPPCVHNWIGDTCSNCGVSYVNYAERELSRLQDIITRSKEALHELYVKEGWYAYIRFADKVPELKS